MPWQAVRCGTGWNTKVLGSCPGGQGYGKAKQGRGKKCWEQAQSIFCPASWQPVWKASVLRLGCNGRSWSFFEALRSWLHDCSLVACCPPGNTTNYYSWFRKLSKLKNTLLQRQVYINSTKLIFNEVAWVSIPILYPFLFWCLWQASEMPANKVKYQSHRWNVIRWTSSVEVQSEMATYIFHIDVCFCAGFHELYPIL